MYHLNSICQCFLSSLISCFRIAIVTQIIWDIDEVFLCKYTSLVFKVRNDRMQSDCGTFPICALDFIYRVTNKIFCKFYCSITCPWGKFSLSVFTFAYCVLILWTCSRNSQICFLATVTNSSFSFFSTTRVVFLPSGSSTLHWEYVSSSSTSFKDIKCVSKFSIKFIRIDWHICTCRFHCF